MSEQGQRIEDFRYPGSSDKVRRPRVF
jgi:hypothetical protein